MTALHPIAQQLSLLPSEWIHSDKECRMLTTTPCNVVWMIRKSLPAVMTIEQASFEFAWTEQDFITCLKQRNCIGMTAESKERTVGFVVYELRKGNLHVLNFAVHPSFRRQGVGSQIVEKLIHKLSQQRRHDITLEVRETNLAAQHFFSRLGFLATKVLRDHYEDTVEDAYVMKYELGESS